MDQPRIISNHLAQLQAQIEALPAEFANLRNELAPSKYRAEVQRILAKLDSQVGHIKARGQDMKALEAKLTAIRAGQE